MTNTSMAETWDRIDWSNWTTGLYSSSGTQMGDNPTLSYPYGLSTQQHIDIPIYGSWPQTISGSGSYSYNIFDGSSINLSQIVNGSLIFNILDYPTEITSGYIQLSDASSNLSNHLPLSPGFGTNTTVTIPSSDITGVNLYEITVVTIYVVTTGACSLNINGVRWISPGWVLTSVDFNNATNVLEIPIPIYVGGTAVIPTTLPPVWRCSNPPGNDPEPINASIYATFNTGSVDHTNSFTLYQRTTHNIPVLQSTLNNQPYMNLNGRPQPFTESTDVFDAFSISCQITWIDDPQTSVSPTVYPYQIQLTNNITGQIIYSFNSLSGNGEGSPGIYMYLGLQAEKNYSLSFSLKDDVASVAIYPVDTSGYLGKPIFNSGPIKDTTVFFREAGHIGIGVNLNDTNANVSLINPYNLVFGVFESSVYNSVTPVWGAQLYSSFTPPIQLFGNNDSEPLWSPVIGYDDNTPVITSDNNRTITGSSTHVLFLNSSTSDEPLPGIISQILSPYDDNMSGITNFNDVSITFDIWANSIVTSVSQPISALLVNNLGYGVQFNLSPFVANQWQPITVGVNEFLPIVVTDNVNQPISPTSLSLIPTGLYQLVLLYDGPSGGEFWIDNVQITQNSIDWYGRSTSDNPYEDFNAWTPFGDTINNNNDGIRFSNPTNGLQIQAQALYQDAIIYNGFTVVPTYGQLGKVITTTPNTPISLTLDAFSVPDTPPTFTFTAGSVSPDNPIANYVWNFGDGNVGFGQVVSHTYNTSGYPQVTTVNVTLTVTDIYGNTGIITEVVSL